MGQKYLVRVRPLSAGLEADSLYFLISRVKINRASWWLLKKASRFVHMSAANRMSDIASETHISIRCVSSPHTPRPKNGTCLPRPRWSW